MPAAPPSRPLSERFSSEALAARGPWAFLAMLGQGMGLLLLFVGTLVMVLVGSNPADCFTAAPPCAGSTAQSVAYGIETARLLWTIGLFGIAAGAGLRLQIVNAHPLPTTPEETRIYLARRRGEFVILVVAILLLFAILIWSTAALPALV